MGDTGMDARADNHSIHELEADMCRALADPTRLRIIYALADGPRSVGGLSLLLGAPQPTVSRHLRVLRDQSLVEASRSGTMVRYQLTDGEVIGALGTLRHVLARTLRHDAAVLEGPARVG
jgi:DNA-binding transcriptional ArsR family regulator